MYFAMYLTMILSLWAFHSDAFPLRESSTPIQPSLTPLKGSFLPVAAVDMHHAQNGLTSNLAVGSRLFRRRRRDINFNSRLGSFPSDARTANDALQDFMKMLEMSKSAYPGPLDEDDEDFDEQPIDIVVSRKPGSSRTVRVSKARESHTANGEDPLDTPIDLVQHHPKTKRPMSPVNPELFLRDAAVSSRTQPEPKFMRKLLERIGYNWNLLP